MYNRWKLQHVSLLLNELTINSHLSEKYQLRVRREKRKAERKKQQQQKQNSDYWEESAGRAAVSPFFRSVLNSVFVVSWYGGEKQMGHESCYNHAILKPGRWETDGERERESTVVNDRWPNVWTTERHRWETKVKDREGQGSLERRTFGERWRNDRTEKKMLLMCGTNVQVSWKSFSSVRLFCSAMCIWFSKSYKNQKVTVNLII